MAEFTLELDAKTLEHVRRIAQARNSSVEHLIREVILETMAPARQLAGLLTS
jgi:hypothetical protein